MVSNPPSATKRYFCSEISKLKKQKSYLADVTCLTAVSTLAYKLYLDVSANDLHNKRIRAKKIVDTNSLKVHVDGKQLSRDPLEEWKKLRIEVSDKI